MDKRKSYFRKQKLAGLVLIAIAVVFDIINKGDMTAALLLLPLGLYLVCTKRMVWLNDYFFEVKDENKES